MTKLCKYLIVSVLVLESLCSTAQNITIDSLKGILAKHQQDTSYVKTLDTLSFLLYRNGYYDSSLSYANKALILSKQKKYKMGIDASYCNMGLNLMGQCKYQEALYYFQNALDIGQELHMDKLIADVYLNIGLIYWNEGNYASALDYYFRSLKIYEKLKKKVLMSDCYNNIGIIYTEEENYDEALKNYNMALSIILSLKDSLRLGDAYFAIGDVYMEKGKDSAALINIEKAIQLGIKQKDKLLQSYAFKDYGMILNNSGHYDSAFYYFSKSLAIKIEMGDKQGEAVNYLNMGKTYLNKKVFINSKIYLDSALLLSNSIGDKKNIRDIYKAYTHLDSATGNYEAVLGHYKLYNTYRDSLTNEESTRKIESEKLSYEFEKQQELDKAEVDRKAARQRIVRNVFIGGFGFALLFAGVFFFQRKRISKERDRSDKLLLNILPAETASELKATGESKARNYPLVTVMFTDFKNFTRLAENMTAEELVKEINYCYKEFDKINARHNVEKIKTMGDGYMAAGGVPHENTSNPVDTVEAAMEIQQFMKNMRTEREAKNQPFFEVRIGIHSGPVVAGIVGLNKFAYDIWGDTVNIASRMESSGEAGKVNVSGATYELVKDKFNCKYRGKVLAKNKGEIDMYFVES
jgi:adenylate cyclase